MDHPSLDVLHAFLSQKLIQMWDLCEIEAATDAPCLPPIDKLLLRRPAGQIVITAFHQLDPALEEAARLSGAGFFRRLADIVVPLIAPAAGASVILVFLIACNELTVSALLWSAGTQTLGVVIYNMDDSGSSDLASEPSVLVVLMVVVMMLLLELLAKRLPKGVVPWRS